MQGIVEFPGIRQVISASYTLSHGITPGAAILEIAPQDASTIPATPQTLVFRYGRTALQFPAAIINFPQLDISGAAAITTLQILDRRWKWRFGRITLAANLRTAAGRIERGTEATPREIAEKCLVAMGEASGSFDVSAMPDELRPLIEADEEQPAAILASLCDQTGCRVVLGLDNRVRICRTGTGNPLPEIPELMAASVGISAKPKPDKLRFVGGPTLYQHMLQLEAVGEETDGAIRPIEELSYKPAGGWEIESPYSFANVLKEHGKESQLAALRSVFRMYRVKGFVDFDASGEAQDSGGRLPRTMSDIREILPVQETLLQTFTDAAGVERRKPAVLRGEYWGQGLGLLKNTEAGAKYRGSWSLDGERGIVTLSDFAIRLGDNNETRPADLQLECTITRQEIGSTRRPFDRYTREIPLGQAYGAPVEILKHEDVVRRVIGSDWQISGSGESARYRCTVTDNVEQVHRDAEAYLQAAALRYTATTTAEAPYAGLIRIEPDGAIQQVQWTISERGTITRASRNTEFSVDVPSYQERRRLEDQAALAQSLATMRSTGAGRGPLKLKGP